MRCVIFLDHGWCGDCYAARRGRECGHRRMPAIPVRMFNPLEEESMAMQRRDEAEVPPAGRAAHDEVLLGWLPNVHEWLTEKQWHDGKKRETTTLMVVVEDGRWKCWVHDRDSKRSAWVTADAWEALWEVLERKLRDNDLEWRKDKR